MIKNQPANAGVAGSIPGSGISLGEEMATHSLPGKFHGQKSLRAIVHAVTKSQTRLRD